MVDASMVILRTKEKNVDDEISTWCSKCDEAAEAYLDNGVDSPRKFYAWAKKHAQKFPGHVVHAEVRIYQTTTFEVPKKK